MNDWMAQLLTFQLYAPHVGLLLVWAMKSSGMVLFAWGVVTVLRRRSAAARCWMWRLCLAGILGLVVFEFGPAFLKRVRPKVAVEPSAVNSPSFQAAVSVIHLLRSDEEIQRLTTPREIGPGDGAAQARPPWQGPSGEPVRFAMSDLLAPWWSVVERALPWFWAGGAVLILVIQIARTVLGRAGLRKSSRPAGGRMLEIGERCARDMELRGLPGVSLSATVRSPLLVGGIRPAIYLPEAAREWAEAKLVSVFLHEMAHAKRGDFSWLQAGRLAGALFWWNPLVWWAARQMNAESEEAADDAVVLRQEGGEAYARALVEIASADPVADTSLGVSMLGYKSLEKRIQALLKENPWRGRVGKVAGWALLAAMLGLVAVGGLYVGLPTARAKAEMPPSERLSEAQGKMLERIIANTKKRLTAQRFTHVKVESMITKETGGVVKTSPLPSKMEAWNDTWTNQYRAEYRPQVSPWTDGAAPFYVRDHTQICNGRERYAYDSNDDMSGLQAKGAEPLYAPYLNISDSTRMIDILGNLLLVKVFKSSNVTYILSETTWQGEAAVKIEEKISADSTSTQTTSFIVLPGKEDFLVASELGNSRRPAPISQGTVEAVGRAADESYYPKKFRSVFQNDQSKTTTDYTVTSFEDLSELPHGILGFPKNPDDPYVAKNDRPLQREALALECVHEKTGRPVPGVEVKVLINHTKEVSLQTDAAGRVSIPLPKGEITYFSAEASHAGFAPRLVRWRKYGDPLQLPEAYQLKLFPASPIAGRVVDAEGKPIAGAEVEMYLSGGADRYSVFCDRFALCGVTTKTDAEGRWSFAEFPEVLDGLCCRISCAGYQATTDMGIADFRMTSGQTYSALRDGTSVIVLKRGAELRGVITDQAGRPVPHCHISMGKDRYGSNLPETESDEDGRYVLPGLEAGKKLVTFEAPGCMPVLQEITLPHDQPLDVVLAPGLTLRARVTMPDGKPSAGLKVNADRWKDTRTLTFSTQTDADGYFTWNGAPEEEVTFSFGACQSREFLCDLPLKAGDEVRQVVMKPALRFSGQAVDAKTGQSIRDVRVVPGCVVGAVRNIHWEKEKAQTFPDGAFDWKTDYIGLDYVFQVAAEGYKTFQTEPMGSKQNDVTQTVRLEAVQ
ncbi:carboxypeptidase regulatory-like domain-containing protein [Terrimicrobium sacchariphilum]|uniref:Carboxypeptidase regulatory-like domain-containing protein n=1 Tax=Terrimicrobium sacchariphilum TaxID=690879 RepID=A0A146G5W3_TERSA|nr:carboxypeptidase regulatory-like domain-containing protein [Terrimicrobium sacchariphilum]GAT32347.1 carboxypeptidase regulatory-like domain-containing protein [Terrimicrobium sacchariphilum]